MLSAIVLVNCSVDSIPEVAQNIADISGVEEVYSVTGEVDLIAMIKVRKYEDLAVVVSDSIAKVPGVRTLTTHLAFRTYSSGELEEAFHLGLD